MQVSARPPWNLNSVSAVSFLMNAKATLKHMYVYLIVVEFCYSFYNNTTCNHTKVLFVEKVLWGSIHVGATKTCHRVSSVWVQSPGPLKKLNIDSLVYPAVCTVYIYRQSGRAYEGLIVGLRIRPAIGRSLGGLLLLINICTIGPTDIFGFHGVRFLSDCLVFNQTVR
jgi:hypothetical protein